MPYDTFNTYGGAAAMHEDTASTKARPLRTKAGDAVDKIRFMVMSGFLGAGKTTTMIALGMHMGKTYGKPGIIANDLGANLVDTNLTQTSGCTVEEIASGCICYQMDNTIDKIRRLMVRDGCVFVMSDIPGLGVGALDHTYHRLADDCADWITLAPFTVLVEPKTVEILRSGAGGDLRYLYDTQLVEADLIVLNKCDLLDAGQREADLAWLKEHYPLAEVIAISALKEEGLEALSRALAEGKASMRRPDIGYGGEAFLAAMGHMCEFYLQYHAVVCCNDFDGNAYLLDMARAVQQGVKAAGHDIPHLKLLAWEPEGDFGKADLLGTDREVEVPHRFERPCTELAVILNASADCPAAELEKLVTETVKAVSDRYQLELLIFKQECFGMGD